MGTELRREYRERLADIEDQLLVMGERALGMLARALDAITGRDPGAATEVIHTDDQLDREYAGVQDAILTTLALQAPVARDLRLVAALLHANIHVERMGDLCVNIARFAELGADDAGDPELIAQIDQMGQLAIRAGRRALEAFAARDPEAARELPVLDDPIDQLNRGLFRRLIDLGGADEQQLDWAIRMVLVARYLERFGDHAVDIAEQAIFAVTGDMVELSSNSPR